MAKRRKLHPTASGESAERDNDLRTRPRRRGPSGLMEPFDRRFPELAEHETRVLTLLQPDGELPIGDYVFKEFYCPDPKCDCRNVLLSVALIRRDQARIVATLNHALDPEKFRAIGFPPTFLEPNGPQSEIASAVMEKAQEILLSNDEYVGRLWRHYRIAKGFEAPPSISGSRRGDSSDPVREAMMEVFSEYGREAYRPTPPPQG